MVIFCFRLQFLFLFVFLAGVLVCSDELTDCGHPIKICEDYECIHRVEDFESHVRVHCNASLVLDLQENVTKQQKKTAGIPPRITSVRLVAYPVLITGSLRYRADFHIEIQYKDLVNVDSILLVFSTRESNEEGFLPEAAVVQRVTKLNRNDDGRRYVTLGCYWHNNYFLANCQITINLEMILFRKNNIPSYGKYYFRIPFWEQFNDEKDVDPCSFAPFVYVGENEESDTEIVSIRSVNCSRPAVVEVEQRKEWSGELMKTDVIYTDEFGIGSTHLKYTKALHYYVAFFEEFMVDSEVSGELASVSVILISILTPLLCIIVLIWWCLREPVFAPRNSLLFLKEKPRVKFLHSCDSKFHVYQAQTETLILFMENHCNIIRADDSIYFHEATKSSPLIKDFDIVILIPFPSIGENDAIDSFTVRAIKQYEVTKKDCIILELPFWSGNGTSLHELCEPFTKWKRFVLMDGFLPLVTYIHRSRSCFRRRYLCPITADDMRMKLEENNMTNEGFLFCLKETFGHSSINSGFAASSPVDFPNLQEMEM